MNFRTTNEFKTPLLFENSRKFYTKNFYEQQLWKANYDDVIAAEVRRLQQCTDEEETNYVSKKLAENPVELGCRARSPHSSSTEDASTKSSGEQNLNIDPEQALLREQRAASCRKSRINNKLKKATLMYRNEFKAQKVQEAKKTLAELREKLIYAEQRCLARGYTVTELAHLRKLYGVEDIDCDAM